jgi:hypothetical protein
MVFTYTMRGVESDDISAIITLMATTDYGLHVYIFPDTASLEDLGIIVHDLAQVLLSEGEVILQSEFLFQEETGGTEIGPKGD